MAAALASSCGVPGLLAIPMRPNKASLRCLWLGRPKSHLVLTNRLPRLILIGSRTSASLAALFDFSCHKPASDQIQLSNLTVLRGI